MKSLKFVLSLSALAAVAAAPLVHAEDMPAPAASTAPDAAKLTPEQQAKIAALMKEQVTALKALKADKKIKEADKKDKAKAIKADFKAQIDAVKAGK